MGIELSEMGADKNKHMHFIEQICDMISYISTSFGHISDQTWRCNYGDMPVFRLGCDSEVPHFGEKMRKVHVAIKIDAPDGFGLNSFGEKMRKVPRKHPMVT